MKGKWIKKLFAMTLTAAMLLTSSVNTYALEAVDGSEEVLEEICEETEEVSATGSENEKPVEDASSETKEAAADDAYGWDGVKTEWTEDEVSTFHESSALQGPTDNLLGAVIDTKTGKFQGKGATNKYAQVNLGTKIYVPVAKEAYYKVTVKAFNNSKDVFKVGAEGGEFLPQTELVKAKSGNAYIVKSALNEDRSRYEVIIEMTKNDYLFSWSVEEFTLPTDAVEDNASFDFTKGGKVSDFSEPGVVIEGFDDGINSGHGLTNSSGKNSGLVYLNLEEGKKANISIEGCKFSSTDDMASTSGVVTNDVVWVNGGSGTDSKWSVSGAEGFTVLRFSYNNMYVHSISVKYLADTAYTVKVSSNDIKKGTVSANGTSFREGEVVVLDVKPAEGCELKEYKVKDDAVAVKDDKFTMPAKDVDITAVFGEKAKYAVKVTVSGNGTASANCISAYAGQEVVLSRTPKAGNIFKGWVVKDNAAVIASNKFTMPEKAVEIFAVFEEATEENSTVDAKLYNFASPTIPKGAYEIKGVVFDGIEGDANSHGILTKKAGATMKLSLREKANITIVTCKYTAGVNATVESSAGTVTKTLIKEVADNDAPKFVIKDIPKGDVTLTFSNNTYIHEMAVEYVKDVGKRDKLDVWDFGGLVESDSKYTNHMTPKAIIDSKMVKEGGLFAGGTTVFGDLSVVANSGDRLYTTVTDDELGKYSNGTYAMATTDKYGEEYQPKGAWYCNGTGGSSRRYVTIANVQAGDKIDAYIGITQNGPSEMYFEGQGGASGQKDTVKAVAGEFQKYEFVAEKTGTYKIYENNTGKPMFHRIVRYPYVEVEGTIDFNTYSGSDHVVKFINTANDKETVAEVKGNNFTAHLAPGFEYLAVLSGAKGYGFTIASNKVNTTNAESFTGKKGVKLVVEPKKQFTYSGTIEGFADGYNTSELKLTFVPVENGVADKSSVKITDKNKFETILQDEVHYTIEMEGVNDYRLKDETPVITAKDMTDAKIEVVLRDSFDVTGKFIGIENDKKVTALSFENVEDKYAYAAAVTEDGYSVKLRAGSYLAKATIDGHKTQTHVVVEDKAVNKDLMFVSTVAKEKIEKVSDIYVGYPGKENNYETMRDAMEACTLMDPQPASEADRITVHIAPGTYREQIFVNTPYVSFVNDSAGEVLLTWYYGIGYKYYSSDGYYNPERAYDKYEKKIADKWGTAVYVKKTATNFAAKGITFENSFNRYVTKEELEDGVECDTLKIERATLDKAGVQSKAATERAAALVIEAPFGEFKDCSFYSSQDTVYTAETAYFKDCFIEGQTDYIFGSGNCVFDTCVLNWKGYSANSLGGYITANRPDAVEGNDKVTNELGYLFRNCVVTANKSTLVDVTAGYFGRPWGPLAKVKFLNTRVEDAGLIDKAGWYEMSGVKPQDVTFLEYNTTDFEGNKLSTEGRIKGANAGIMTDEQAAAIDVKAYFVDKSGKNTWTPKNFAEEAAELKFETAPFISDNGDLNTPYPGHTLTVGYSFGKANDANDISTIKWYAVKDGEEKLLKTTNAVAGKTYKITADAVGSKIKVVVEPKLISGKTAEAASCTTDAAVIEGYEDPDNPGADPVLGEGINVFLAGDSTVKDYTASGINSGGSARNEGSWGEYLQYYLNDKATVINYANGGRSSRSFINDGSLGKIEKKIGKGDYLFIQFGHNDCADGEQYLVERYCPLGTPDANGVYPVTPGVKKATPADFVKNYGDTCYTVDCGGTYKWYLLQYIEVARKAGATPVLVTPVSRMNYTADGKIKPHHDSSDTTNNAYCTAVKQLGSEENVLVIDGFEFTKKLFEDAYAACGSKTYGSQLMFTGDSTHCNKLGGFIEAAAMADAIIDAQVDGKNLSLAYAVKTPSRLKGINTDGTTVVAVDDNGNIEAYDTTDNFASRAAYWEKTGKNMITKLGRKVKVLAGEDPGKEDPEEEPGLDDDVLKAIDETASKRDELENDKTKTNTIGVLQSKDDTIKVEENWVKGKVKSLNVAVSKESVEAKVTLNTTAKFQISGDINLDKSKGELTTFEVVKESVSALNGTPISEKSVNAILKAVNKKGVIAPKVIKENGKALNQYGFVVKFKGVSGAEHSLTVSVVNATVKEGIPADKTNMSIYSVATNKKGEDVTKLAASNAAYVEDSMESSGVAVYKYSVTNAEEILSASWKIDKTSLKPGDDYKPFGSKKAGDGKDFAMVRLSKDATAIYVKPIAGKAGALKANVVINGKKYALTVKVLNK